MLNVHVYNRHRPICPHRKNRFWKKCSCPKWVTWHRDGKEYRVSADTREWKVAAAKALKIESDFRETLDPKPKPEGVSIDHAVSYYIADKEAQRLKPATIEKLTTIFEKQMVPYFHDLGITMLKDVTLPQLQNWRISWEDGALAAKKKQERVKGFFYFCQRNDWITKNPGLNLARIKVEAHTPGYFPPDEFKKIVAAVDRFGKIEDQRARLLGMVYLLRWSGLAIRDAVTLERSMLGADDRLILRRVKTGVAVMLPLQPQIADYLRNRMKPSNDKYFFWSGRGLPKSAVADWQRALRRLFDIAGLKNADGSKKRCHPHMFRHTFAIELLRSGVPVEDVAKLLGHSSIRTTEKHYSQWVKARADKLEESVRASWTT